MDIKNITKSQRLKSYKELCGVIGEKTKGGDSKKAQLKEFGSLCDYHKDGNAFVIDEVYDTKRIIEDGRSMGNKSVYGENIRLLLLNLLAQSSTGDIFLPTCKILKELKMVNGDYWYGNKERMKQLSVSSKIGQVYIEDFYNYTHNTMKDSLESALNTLMRMALVYWTKAMVICIDEDFELGKDVESGRRSANKEYRAATDTEIKEVISIENRILHAMNFVDTHEVVVRGRWKDFMKNVNDALYEDTGILFFYNAYKVLSNKEHIITKLETLKKKSIEAKLNSDLVTNLKINSQKRYITATQKRIGAIGWGTQDISKGQKLRQSIPYVKNSSNLIDRLVSTERVVKPIKSDK